jgi:hypothetical protein
MAGLDFDGDYGRQSMPGYDTLTAGCSPSMATTWLLLWRLWISRRPG